MPILCIAPESAPLPLLRWAGSKRKLLGKLEDSAPRKFSRYYEPFFGSGCLFFRLQPRAAVLGDINWDLISFYRQTMKRPLRVLRSARSIRKEAKDYYRVRAKFADECDLTRRASYFYFLNKLCFNGIYRTNNAGIFNVPFGTDTGSFPAEKEFRASVGVLRKARFVCADFETTLATARRGDFVYIDPPYVYQDRKDRGEYGHGSFSVVDIARLRKTMNRLDRRGVKFLLSYLDCIEAGQLSKGYDKETIAVKRCVSGLVSARTEVNEILVRNY